MRRSVTAPEEDGKGDWMTPPEAASSLCVHRGTIWKWLKAGLLRKYLTPSGRTMVRREDVLSLYRPFDPDGKP